MPSSAPSLPDRYPLSLPDALPIWALPGADVVVHVEPSEPRGGLRERATAAAWGIPEVREVHNVRAMHLGDGYELSLHVKLPRELSRSEEHTSELQSPCNLVCRLLLPRSPTATLFPYPTLFRSGRFPVPTSWCTWSRANRGAACGSGPPPPLGASRRCGRCTTCAPCTWATGTSSRCT